MFVINPSARRRQLSLAVSLLALSCAAPALGQSMVDQASTSDRKGDSKRVKVNSAKPTSPNATINLVNLLVDQGVLKQEQADALIKQAENEAYVSRQAAKDASARAEDAAKAANAAASAANPPGTRHVTYVPEVVKKQLREEIRQEVMAKAEKENWASPGAYPEWAHRIHFYGDFRARYQGSFFPKGNDQNDAINFNAINTGSPFDNAIGASNLFNAPTYNASQDRNQVRLRARLGMDADLTHGFDAGLRIATGETNSPVSTNQTLGGSGGDFSKYALWLDRGYLKWTSFNQDIVASIGRFDNPFWSPTDLVWYSELGFDGVAFQAKHQVNDYFMPFGTIGAFPIFNTSLNLSTNLQDLRGAPSQVPSHDKWLFGGQLGFGSRFDPQTRFRLAAAYYDFENVQGQLSAPCVVGSSADVCSSDLSRPSFAQKGNTYMALRNIIADPLINNNGQILQFQYFGLVQKYRPVVASAQLDFGQFNPYHIVLDGEFVWNSAFNRGLTAAGTGLDPQTQSLPPGAAINNRAGTPTGTFGPFNGGDQGWMARVTVGDNQIRQFGDWNVHAGYKFLESDATLDAFVDSDFGLGGTNLKGYFVGGNVGLSENVWASARWLSANNIAGSPYAVDVLLVDLNARF
ncbi:MAG: putative porin [Bradyrhizobium sp.]|uniref:putative porin n=1 Tax=Bradyrhizobium sp. TaxID=376 RepID=UPI001D789D96|nr:putative porin [Bradyrhizobium sp.]MBV9563132.1 putative porin [Bradyrhizobium sp.]